MKNLGARKIIDNMSSFDSTIARFITDVALDTSLTNIFDLINKAASRGRYHHTVDDESISFNQITRLKTLGYKITRVSGGYIRIWWVMTEEKNSWGITPHVTDKYVYRAEKYPVKRCLALREAWDKIKDKENLCLLLDAAYDMGKIDGWKELTNEEG